MQIKLQHARQEQDITLSEKQQLERKLEEEAKGSTPSLYQSDPTAELELRRLREEVDILRGELQRAEGELEDRLCWSPPPELQHWLQLTYELEQRVYNKKRLQAEKQLEQAKDAVIVKSLVSTRNTLELHSIGAIVVREVEQEAIELRCLVCIYTRSHHRRCRQKHTGSQVRELLMKRV